MPVSPIDVISPKFRNTAEICLVRKLADGGMGSVYEAVVHGPKGFEKTIAVKTILGTYSRDERFLDMFVDEARLVADLVHQNICQVYQLGKMGNRYFIAMEYIGGVDLRQFMKRHQRLKQIVPRELVTFIISRVCRGLEYAHAKRDRKGNLLGVVHRDVSPGNIMISLEGEVKLTDFGVAKARRLKDRSANEGKVLVGKYRYMAPEQARYEPTDARSDLFSLGVVMFELLTGKTLFGARSGKATLRKLLESEIPRPRSIDRSIPLRVEKIVMRALQRDVDARYQSAGEMGYDLEYEMYHKGYGPTIVALEKYMREFFPRVYRGRGSATDETLSFTECRFDPDSKTASIRKPRGTRLTSRTRTRG